MYDEEVPTALKFFLKLLEIAFVAGLYVLPLVWLAWHLLSGDGQGATIIDLRGTP